MIDGMNKIEKKPFILCSDLVNPVNHVLTCRSYDSPQILRAAF